MEPTNPIFFKELVTNKWMYVDSNECTIAIMS